MEKKTIIYEEGGDRFRYSHPMTAKEVNTCKYNARIGGHIGYLRGYTDFTSNRNARVYVFFKSEPSKSDVRRRRRNGLKNIKWYEFKEEA